MADRELWQPGPGAYLVSQAENARVRSLLKAWLRAQAAGGEPGPEPYGRARKALAYEWLRLAGEMGLKKPGEPRRTPLAPGEDPVERQADAAHTRIRQFQEGHAEYGWVLTGIEAAISSLEGRQLPPAAYQGQGELPL